MRTVICLMTMTSERDIFLLKALLKR
jgi:hypothetical protein